MREFGARRLGNVLGIERVGLDTIEKAREVFDEVFGNDKTSRMVLAMRHHAELLDRIIIDSGVSENSINESNLFINKLFQMRDLYVNDAWNSPVRISEWIGFFNGAALIHWKILRGVAEKEENDELKELSLKCLGFYEEGLNSLSNITFEFGRDSA